MRPSASITSGLVRGPAAYFRDDVDHITWTRLFVRTLDRFGWTCIAVELSTHWHALVDVPDESLPRGMHFLNSTYAKAFNGRHDRVGYLFAIGTGHGERQRTPKS